MALILHSHPLSSFCWKVLIALYEKRTPFEARTVALHEPEARAAFRTLWPTAKIPLLQDGDRIIPETSIMIEYLDLMHPGAVRLLPEDAETLLTVRLWDRLFDLHVMQPVQRYVAQHLRPEGERDARALADALADLATAYEMIDERLQADPWAAGGAFSLADCAAAPALFYASILLPFPAERTSLGRYFEQLLARPSVARVIRDAQPYFRYFPLRDAMPARFLAAENSAA